MRMSKKIIMVLITVVLVALIGFYAIVDKNHPIYDAKIDNSELQSLELQEKDTVSQTFCVTEDLLDGVEMKMMVAGEPEEIVLKYELLDESGKQVLDGTCTMEDFKNGKFFEIRFDRVKGCKGKTYRFRMTVDACAKENTLSLYYADPQETGTSFVKPDGSVAGTMVLRTITHRFDIETFVVTACFAAYVVWFMRWLSKLFR